VESSTIPHPHAIFKSCYFEKSKLSSGKPPAHFIRLQCSGRQVLCRYLGWLGLDQNGQFGGWKLQLRSWASAATCGARSVNR